jgi:hypothetical protein
VGWFVGWLVDGLFGWLIGWLVSWLFGWVVGMSVGQLFQLSHIKFFGVYFTSAVILIKSIILTIMIF